MSALVHFVFAYVQDVGTLSFYKSVKIARPLRQRLALLRQILVLVVKPLLHSAEAMGLNL